MTTDTTALQERIADALTDHWKRKHSTLLTSGPCSGCSRAAADAVSAEAQAAKAEAWTDCVSEASALGWLHAPAALDMLDRNPHETGGRA